MRVCFYEIDLPMMQDFSIEIVQKDLVALNIFVLDQTLYFLSSFMVKGKRSTF